MNDTFIERDDAAAKKFEKEGVWSVYYMELVDGTKDDFKDEVFKSYH